MNIETTCLHDAIGWNPEDYDKEARKCSGS